MSAVVEHSFTGGFLLDEERLRKIRDILHTRLGKAGSHVKPAYRVYRGDSFSYVTDAVEDVAKDENEDWRRITRLDIKVEDESLLKLFLLFSSAGCELRIVGDDRDEVFLLFSDLRDYIGNEVVNRERIFSPGIRTVMVVLVMLTTTVLAAWMLSRFRTDPQVVGKAMASSDVGEKLNYLIDNTRKSDPGQLGLGLIVLAFIFVGVTAFPFDRVSRYLFPRNEFLFGQRKVDFDKRQRLVSNLFWLVGVGLAVGVAAGIIVWLATRPR
jgi:multisubunit Na+/H+ antiporter MnhB subunit